MKKFLYLVFCGVFIGLSLLAPGFSGSMIAITLGIYQDILRIAADPFKNFKENVIFALPIGIGVLLGGVLFLLTLKVLFVSYEKATYLLFVGLIIGNLPTILAEIKKHKYEKSYMLVGFVAFLLALILGIIPLLTNQPASGKTGSFNILLIGLGGFAGGAAIIVPGLGISMALIVIGIYRQVLIMADALIHFDFSYLGTFIVFGLCAVLGLIVTSKGIRYTFDKYPGLANSSVFGFLVGTAIGILLQSLAMPSLNFNWLIGCLAATLGLIISLAFVLIGNSVNKQTTD